MANLSYLYELSSKGIPLDDRDYLHATGKYFPNPDIENTIIAQSLGTSSKSRKCLITNEVTTNFLDLLYAPIDCTLFRISISGFGNFPNLSNTY